MTSATIHTDTSEQEEVKAYTLSVQETGRKLIVCEIGGVTLLISNSTAKLIIKELSSTLKEFQANPVCTRHEIELDENHECQLCVKEDIEFDLAQEYKDASI